MGEAPSTRRETLTPVAQVTKGAVIRATIHGKAGPWIVQGVMQTSKGSYAVTVKHQDGPVSGPGALLESFVVGPSGTLRVLA